MHPSRRSSDVLRRWPAGAPRRRIALALCVGVLLGSQAAVPTPAIAAADPVVYQEALSPAWADWSWAGPVDLNHQPGYLGTRSIGWRITAPWAGLYLHSAEPVPTGVATSLRFAFRTTDPSAGVSLRFYGPGNAPVGWPRLVAEFGGMPAGAWKLYDIPLGALGAAGQSLSGLVVQDATGTLSQPLVQLDEVMLAGLPVPGPVEVRPANTVANNTRGRPTRPELFNVNPSFRPYYDKINGDYVGTTEQILAWAARKWGFDQLGYPDLAKAMAVNESWWDQSAVNRTGPFGILQVNPNAWPDTEPARWSTAYNADYAMAVVRYLYDPGSWLRAGTTGNIRHAVAAWECGCGYNGTAAYADQVFTYNVTKPWLRPGQPPEWF
jgi:hypothetical protein